MSTPGEASCLSAPPASRMQSRLARSVLNALPPESQRWKPAMRWEDSPRFEKTERQEAQIRGQQLRARRTEGCWETTPQRLCTDFHK